MMDYGLRSREEEQKACAWYRYANCQAECIGDPCCVVFSEMNTHGGHRKNNTTKRTQEY